MINKKGTNKILKKLHDFEIHNIIINGDTTMFDFIIKYNTFDLIKMAMRYETVRKLNACQFTKIFRRSINGENFDEIIDKYGKE